MHLICKPVFLILSTALLLSGCNDDEHIYPQPSWSAPELLENAPGNADQAQLAQDDSGNAIVVWEQLDGARHDIWACRYNAASRAWEAPVTLENNDWVDARYPRIAINAGGTATVIWQQDAGALTNIWASRYSAGVWGPAVQIDSELGDADNARIAIDSAGNALAVWRQIEGPRYDIWYCRYNGGWAAAAKLETDDAGGANGPQVACEAAGAFMTVWYQNDGTRDNIWARRYSGGSWSDATLIEHDDSGNAVEPLIACDAAGNALAVWYQSDGTHGNIWAGRYAGGVWGAPLKLNSQDMSGTSTPQLAVNAAGEAVAVWGQHDGARIKLWACRYTGGSWGAAQPLETNAAGDVNDKAVALDPAGNATVIWLTDDGTARDLWTCRYAADSGRWSNPIEFENRPEQAYGPVLVLNAAGEALAVWSQEVGGAFSIFASRRR